MNEWKESFVCLKLIWIKCYQTNSSQALAVNGMHCVVHLYDTEYYLHVSHDKNLHLVHIESCSAHLCWYHDTDLISDVIFLHFSACVSCSWWVGEIIITGQLWCGGWQHRQSPECPSITAAARQAVVTRKTVQTLEVEEKEDQRQVPGSFQR